MMSTTQPGPYSDHSFPATPADLKEIYNTVTISNLWCFRPPGGCQNIQSTKGRVPGVPLILFGVSMGIFLIEDDDSPKRPALSVRVPWRHGVKIVFGLEDLTPSLTEGILGVWMCFFLSFS